MQEKRKRQGLSPFRGKIDVKSRKNLLGFTRKRKRRQWGRKFGIPRSAGRPVAGQAALRYRWPWPTGLAATTRGGSGPTAPASGPVPELLQGSSTEAGAVAVS
jgi:hypothetical protein